MRRRARSLTSLMRYRNPGLIERFRSIWKVSVTDANEILDDLKRYLWLVTQPRMIVIAPVAIVDEMWHTFLDLTIDYREFTTEAFGRFVDHVPTSEREKRAFRKRLQTERGRRQFEENFHAQLRVVRDLLGEDVLLRWYVDYPTRYDQRFFRTARLPRAHPDLRFSRSLRRTAARGRAVKG